MTNGQIFVRMIAAELKVKQIYSLLENIVEILHDPPEDCEDDDDIAGRTWEARELIREELKKR